MVCVTKNILPVVGANPRCIRSRFFLDRLCMMSSKTLSLGVVSCRESETHKTSKVSAEELNTAARVLYAEATGSTSTVTEEQLAIASTMRNRLGRYLKNKHFSSLKEVLKENHYNGSNGPKFNNSAPDKAICLDANECKDLKNAIEAIKKVFSSEDSLYDYTDYKGYKTDSEPFRIGGHYFGNTGDWSEYQGGDKSISKYKTYNHLIKMKMKKIKVGNGMKPINRFKKTFGYTEGATKEIQKWNPGVNFNRLKCGQDIWFFE